MGEVGAHNRGVGGGRGLPPGQEDMTVGQKKYYIDYSICARKTNSVMVIIIIHVAHITCLVTKDAWHDYGVIGV